MCRVIVYIAWLCRDGVCFGSVRAALLLAVVFRGVDRCVGSWVLLGAFCILCVTQECFRLAARALLTLCPHSRCRNATTSCNDHVDILPVGDVATTGNCACGLTQGFRYMSAWSARTSAVNSHGLLHLCSCLTSPITIVWRPIQAVHTWLFKRGCRAWEYSPGIT